MHLNSKKHKMITRFFFDWTESWTECATFWIWLVELAAISCSNFPHTGAAITPKPYIWKYCWLLNFQSKYIALYSHFGCVHHSWSNPKWQQTPDDPSAKPFLCSPLHRPHIQLVRRPSRISHGRYPGSSPGPSGLGCWMEQRQEWLLTVVNRC